MKLLLFFLSSYLAFSFGYKGRIIGGQPVAAGQYPFLAAIYKSTSDGQYFCGGSVVNNRWILTAGQCVYNATLFTIYLGTNNIKNLDSTAVKLATEEYVLHPEYNPITLENDIGLIKTRMDIPSSNYIRTTLMPWARLPDNFGGIRVMGWGQTSDEQEIVDELQWVQLTSITNEDCKLTYGDQVKDNMLCVVGNYNEGTCHGDTGSPLVEFYRAGTPIHQGIASFVSANGCESPDPSGFTRTYNYVEWIRNVTDVTEK